MNIGKTLLLLAILTLFLIGCTSKTNPVGSDWSHIRPALISDSLITDQFSFTKEYKLSGAEQKLIVGNYEQKEAKALIQFTTFPDSIYQIIGTPSLKLVIGRRNSTTPLTLHFGKVVQNWVESQATWTHATTDTLWQATYINDSGIADFSNIPDSISVNGDTLHIDIPATSILQWNIPSVTGYSLQISTENANYLEIKSSETTYGPELSFKYKRTASDTTTYSYQRIAANDTFILNDTNSQLTSSSLFLRNLSPTRIYMKFNVPGSLFTYNDENSDTLSAQDVKRMTINKAELVLKVKDNPYLRSTENLMALVYAVKDTVMSDRVIADDEMEFLTYTPTTLTKMDTGTVSFNFTPVMQAFTSGAKPNYGIIIKLTTENIDYQKVEFYGINDPNPSLRPKINIIYTPPFFQ